MNAIIFLTRPVCSLLYDITTGVTKLMHQQSEQSSEVEIPIGFAVALSCVMSSRLCLNVRGFILDDADIPASSAAHPPRRNGLVSFGRGEDASAQSSNHSVSVVHGGDTLTALEMRELRVMRAESPKHFKIFSGGKSDENCADELVHIA